MPTLEERLQRLEFQLKRLQRFESQLGTLLEDSRIGDALLGPLPEAPSSMSLRHRGDEYYLGGCLAIRPTFDTLVVAANRLYAIPFYMPSVPNMADRIAVRVTSAAGTLARLGIYDEGENLYPGRLLDDSGTVATNGTGIKTITIRKGLSRGLKWLAAVFNGTPTMFSLNGGSVGTWAVLGAVASADWEDFLVGWSVEFGYAALPAKFPDVSGATKRLQEPVIALRFT